jgi:carbonic anhydrase
MKTILLGTCTLMMLVLFSCGKETKTDLQIHDGQEKHWSYEGETSPEHWAEIEKNSDCSGMSQSPINIIDINTVAASQEDSMLQFYYSEKTVLNKVRNNGHSIQYDFERGDSIRNKNKNYNLVQIHFHEPSEHTINGVRYPIEIHLVHQSDQKDYTVIGIMGVEGGESHFLKRMETYLPLEVNEEKVIERSFDITTILPVKRDFYTYQGSLTTPPCTENVQWIILKSPLELSLEEVLKLKSNMPLKNYRDEQPLNDRKVYLIQEVN